MVGGDGPRRPRDVWLGLTNDAIGDRWSAAVLDDEARGQLQRRSPFGGSRHATLRLRVRSSVISESGTSCRTDVSPSSPLGDTRTGRSHHRMKRSPYASESRRLTKRTLEKSGPFFVRRTSPSAVMQMKVARLFN